MATAKWRWKILFLKEDGYDARWLVEVLSQIGAEVVVVRTVVELYEELIVRQEDYQLFLVGLFVQWSPCIPNMQDRMAAVGLQDGPRTHPPGLALLKRLHDRGLLDKVVVYTTVPYTADDTIQELQFPQERVLDCGRELSELREFLARRLARS